MKDQSTAKDFIEAFNKVLFEYTLESVLSVAGEMDFEYYLNIIKPIDVMVQIINISYMQLPDDVKDNLSASGFIDSLVESMDIEIANKDEIMMKYRYDKLFKKLAFKTGMWRNLQIVKEDYDGADE